MGNSSSSELPLAGVICLAVFGYTALIFIIVFIRYMCVRQGKCQDVECGMCGKEGAPQCSDCCISCSESCGCSAPSVNNCLNNCCPNKKLTCLDILLCQCCLGENNCFTNLYYSKSCEIHCGTEGAVNSCRERILGFFNCEDFLMNFSCYEDYIHGESCCHYSCKKFWNTLCDQKSCPKLCSCVDLLRALCRRARKQKVESVDEGIEVSLESLESYIKSKRGHHHGDKQRPITSDSETEISSCKVHRGHCRGDKHQPVSSDSETEISSRKVHRGLRHGDEHQPVTSDSDTDLSSRKVHRGHRHGNKHQPVTSDSETEINSRKVQRDHRHGDKHQPITSDSDIEISSRKVQRGHRHGDKHQPVASDSDTEISSRKVHLKIPNQGTKVPHNNADDSNDYVNGSQEEEDESDSYSSVS